MSPADLYSEDIKTEFVSIKCTPLSYHLFIILSFMNCPAFSSSSRVLMPMNSSSKPMQKASILIPCLLRYRLYQSDNIHPLICSVLSPSKGRSASGFNGIDTAVDFLDHLLRFCCVPVLDDRKQLSLFVPYNPSIRARVSATKERSEISFLRFLMQRQEFLQSLGVIKGVSPLTTRTVPLNPFRETAQPLRGHPLCLWPLSAGQKRFCGILKRASYLFRCLSLQR